MSRLRNTDCMELPLAHVGHWGWYFLYAVPVVVVLASIVANVLRSRRENRGSGQQPDG
jgi:hypothetical protein